MYWGVLCPGFSRLMVLPCIEKPEIMVVSEQGNLPKEIREARKIPQGWDPTRKMLEDLVKASRGELRGGVIPKINDLPGGRVLSEFDGERFHRLYWTHFIKCPGWIRNEERPFKISACADKFLLKEISVLKPKLIICVGAHATGS